MVDTGAVQARRAFALVCVFVASLAPVARRTHANKPRIVVDTWCVVLTWCVIALVYSETSVSKFKNDWSSVSQRLQLHLMISLLDIESAIELAMFNPQNDYLHSCNLLGMLFSANYTHLKKVGSEKSKCGLDGVSSDKLCRQGDFPWTSFLAAFQTSHCGVIEV